MGSIAMRKTLKPATPAKENRKQRMVAAAEALLRERGLAGVTTRAIAEAVQCSEGAIYVHFKDRLDLLLAVLQQSLPEMLVPLHALEDKVGTATPRQNLTTALTGLMRFHDRVTPMLCSLMTETELLQRFRQSLESSGKGPHRGIATLERYLEREQKLGRISPHVDTRTAASVLMASSFFHTFTAPLLGTSPAPEVKRLIDFSLQSKDAPH
jgi:AcrR family transcriptional regulator